MISDVGLWVFDNDHTLFRNVAPLEMEVERLMIAYIQQKRSCSLEYATQLRRSWLFKHKTPGTIMALRGEGFDVQEAIQYTYLAANVFGLVEPDIAMRRAIISIPGPKVVLTNNPKAFAFRVLTALALEDLFEEVFGLDEMSFMPKPSGGAFACLAKRMVHPTATVMVDDHFPTVVTAHRMGFKTILVGNTAKSAKYITHAVDSVLDIPSLLQ